MSDMPYCTLKITRVGKPRDTGVVEVTHVNFLIEGADVDKDEISAALEAVEDGTCSNIEYYPTTREGSYAVVDESPRLTEGQIIPIERISPLADAVLRDAYDAGVLARELQGDHRDAYWLAWWDYERQHPVDPRRVGTQSLYFHGGYHGQPYSPELAIHPLNRINSPLNRGAATVSKT